MKKNMVVIVGPTATGKTRMGVKLAQHFHGEIISADSRQVYRGMDLGTGKDLSEYRLADTTIPCHLIDIIDPEEEFNVFEYQKRFYDVFRALRVKGVLPVVVGGTGLYLEAVLAAYEMPAAGRHEELRQNLADKSMDELREMLLSMKPHLHNKTDLEDRERLIRKIEIEQARKNSTTAGTARPRINACVFGLCCPRPELRERITARLKQRLAAGLVQEVAQLHAGGLSWERLDSFGLEYRYVARYLQKQMTREEMIARLEIAIGQFAKRQMTWFRRMEKKGIQIHWLDAHDYNELETCVTKMLQ
ncbi:MAG TPA: tRNA (adenosine(37)-N6)-dimethylallyltransferase MiaA [Smithellaceae bacterium]|nr:tRNA (adenosine(37)-N6)-dimethylallyltransferase MiaA [Smithellaceae bacterium]HQF83556.1 tRNA (adenosine(37)-N6)-dimethylallyltransferase MiaA [Smithellaceae bacterium]HQG79540.1 tRNA (adenosine(37)-N6)-dimethylallyltransferase MiaA [Smithellaceae bacterium]